MILGVGPMRDGLVPVIIEERLEQLGAWLQVNGEAIYSTNPWRIQNDTAALDVFFTSNAAIVYALFFNWPANNILSLYHPIPNQSAEVTLLGSTSTPLKWSYTDSVMNISLPGLTPQLASIPGNVWTLRMENIK